MKLLADPVWTLRKISGCSCYYKYKSVVLELLKQFPDLIVYFIVPDPNANGNWELDDLIQHERVINIPVSQSNIRWNEYYREPDGFIDKFGFAGKYGDWDILMTSRVPMVSYMKMAGTFTARSPEKHVIILDDLPIMDFKEAIGMFNKTLQERMQVQGYLNSNVSFVFAGFERDNIIRKAADYISSAEVRRLIETMKTGYFVLPKEDKLVVKRKDEFKLVYIQRMDKTERRPEDAFKAMKNFYVMNNKPGMKVTCDIYTNSISAGPKSEEFTFINFFRLQREEYHQKLREANLFVSFSIDEGFPLAVYEAIVNGSIGIIYKAAWSIDMLGKDYPFFFRTDAEALLLIKECAKNWKKEYKKFNEWRKTLHTKYAGKNFFINEIVESIRNYQTNQRQIVKRNNMAFDIVKAYEKEKSTTVDLNNPVKNLEIRKAIFAGTNDYRGAFNDYQHTRQNLLHIFRWKDTVNKGIFIKVKK